MGTSTRAKDTRSAPIPRLKAHQGQGKGPWDGDGGTLDEHSLLEIPLRDRDWGDILLGLPEPVWGCSVNLSQGPSKVGLLGTSDLVELNRAEHVDSFREQLLDVAQEVGVHWGTG